MGKFVVIDHPLVQSKISMIRNIETGNKEFRELVEEIATLICYEATREISLTNVEIETPVCKMTAKIVDKKIAIIPILRAGLGMVNGMHNLLPTAKVGHIGMYRDPKTLKAIEYYCKLPIDSEDTQVLLIDPMLATGSTASMAIQLLKDKGVKNIKFLCLVACKDGKDKITADHPDVDVYTAAYDEELNEHGYIVPGLGDAGDRLFGTK
jgi:uracil phosphoribosyltransferase